MPTERTKIQPPGVHNRTVTQNVVSVLRPVPSYTSTMWRIRVGYNVVFENGTGCCVTVRKRRKKVGRQSGMVRIQSRKLKMVVQLANNAGK